MHTQAVDVVAVEANPLRSRVEWVRPVRVAFPHVAAAAQGVVGGCGITGTPSLPGIFADAAEDIADLAILPFRLTALLALVGLLSLRHRPPGLPLTLSAAAAAYALSSIGLAA